MPVTNVDQDQIQDAGGNYIPGYTLTFTIPGHTGTFTAEIDAEGDIVAKAAAAIAAITQTVEGIYAL